MHIIMCMSSAHSLNAMKTERVTFLASPDFKQYLTTQAANDGVSVGELIRSRCLLQQKMSARAKSQERELRALAAELQRALAQAQGSLTQGLQAAESAMSSIRAAARRKAA